MYSLQEVADRRNYLLLRLTDVEEDLKIPELRPKVRKGALHMHLALTAALHELEMLLGLRSSTIVDLV